MIHQIDQMICCPEDASTKVGSFENFFHDIGGEVYLVDEYSLLLKNFTYDGTGPDAFLVGGTGGQPNSQPEAGRGNTMALKVSWLSLL